jgi:2-C-methyl-D-erythritol 4-phosphate cytidylyltransferase
VIWAVVPAAGVGRRAGLDLPKQYAVLAGRPLLAWTLQRLLAHPRVAGAMVVLAGDDKHWPGWPAVAGKPVRTCTGADDRAGSVRAGLAALAGEVAVADWVLVHDGARPCLALDELDALIVQGCSHPVGALLALPVTDTLKQANARAESIGSLPREQAWRAQTPQLFRYGELCAALDRARADGVAVTDEAGALERLGRLPLLVPGRAGNLKVTTADDLDLAAWYLGRTQDSGSSPSC